ncbi:MAG: hypothetical protein IPJ47_07210 [Anaerolineales bacterium]|nr:hypothetical protein [Anaerolineales bacterium]
MLKGCVRLGILCYLSQSDEEAGGDYGAKFWLKNTPDLFKDIKYAIGEFGGFTLRHWWEALLSHHEDFEKQICWMLLFTVRRGARVEHACERRRNRTFGCLSEIITKK